MDTAVSAPAASVAVRGLPGEESFPFPGLLPYTETNKRGDRITVEWLREDQLTEVYRLVQSVGQDALGIDPSIFSPEQRMRHFLTPIIRRMMAVALIHETTSELIGIYFVHPSPICRSASPVMHAGYGILAKHFQETGISRLGGRIYGVLGVVSGYLGINGRVSQRNTIAFARLADDRGAMLTAWLPKACNTPALGWTDDVLICMDYRALDLQLIALQSATEDDVIAHAKRTTKPLQPHGSEPLRPLETQLVLPNGCSLNFRATFDSDDVRTAYVLLSAAAEQGDGFGIDEFPTEQIFRERFLAGRQLLLAADQEATVAVLVLGASHLCRSPGSPSGLFYLHVVPAYRRGGVGRVVLRALERHAQNCGFTSLHTDVYVTLRLPYAFLRKERYTCVGSVLNSGYIHGQGWTDCLLFYKSFAAISMANL